LVSNGHPWSSVQDYTLSEIGLFYKSIVILEKQRRVSSLIDAWTSNNAGHKELKSMIDELSINAINTTPATKEEFAEVKSEWIRLQNFMRTRK